MPEERTFSEVLGVWDAEPRALRPPFDCYARTPTYLIGPLCAEIALGLSHRLPRRGGVRLGLGEGRAGVVEVEQRLLDCVQLVFAPTPIGAVGDALQVTEGAGEQRIVEQKNLPTAATCTRRT